MAAPVRLLAQHVPVLLLPEENPAFLLSLIGAAGVLAAWL